MELFAYAIDRRPPKALDVLNGWVDNFANNATREPFRRGQLAPALLMLGWAGFKLTDDVAWLNAHSFADAPEHIQQKLSKREPNQAIGSPPKSLALPA